MNNSNWKRKNAMQFIKDLIEENFCDNWYSSM